MPDPKHSAHPTAVTRLRPLLGRALAGCVGVLFSCWIGEAAPPVWDNLSDTWVATDALGRTIPGSAETGPPRSDRTVGLFYFLWLGEHAQGGPYDISRILRTDPKAMEKASSPLWGPLQVPHHWGESVFGYYRTRDEGVLRKHAQMLGDAGVDVVIFDVSNQVTYRDDYLALLRVWSDVRAAGNRTPQIAFLTPFWDPAKVVRELHRDLYAPGLHRDLWFQWDGRPLILADPDLLETHRDFPGQDYPAELNPRQTLGHVFTTDRPFVGVGGRFPTWNTSKSAVTLTLYHNGPQGERLQSRRFETIADNAWLTLRWTRELPAGTYYLEAAEPAGHVGWWSHRRDSQPQGQAMAQGQPVDGDRTLRLIQTDPGVEALRQFFTFRTPQPDYFRGPTRPDMWSWLEVFPQHVFPNARGEKEQMSVGVAQNAVNGRLGSMSEPGSFGRSRHHGTNDTRPDAVRHGLNFAEQAAHALQQDPRFVFITGWNEWIAGRFAEFNGVRRPVMFVDQFDQEHSRDLEPMRGGHGDDYFYQMSGFIRRYKGARPLGQIKPASVRIDGRFTDWTAVEPEFRDTIGDAVARDAPGWDTNVVYRNTSGRNDLVAAKVTYDTRSLSFYARSRDALSPSSGEHWMVLFLNVDGVTTNGWLGYDVVINRLQAGSIEHHAGATGRFTWRAAASTARWKAEGRELELSVRWRDLNRNAGQGPIDFKWTDHLELNGDWSDFTLNGDVAPNDRFNYRAVFPSVP